MTIAEGQVFSLICLIIYCAYRLGDDLRSRKGMKIPELYQVPAIESDEAHRTLH